MEVEEKPSGDPETDAKRKPRLLRLMKKTAFWAAGIFVGACLVALANSFIVFLLT